VANLVIRQFDVFDNPSAVQRGKTPFVAVLQSHHLHGIATAVVAPLHAASIERLAGLCVEVEVNEIPVVLVASELAHLPAIRLRRKVGSPLRWDDDIRRALDRLFTGF